MTLRDSHLIATYEGKKIYAVICYDTSETLPCFLKLPEAIDYARTYRWMRKSWNTRSRVVCR